MIRIHLAYHQRNTGNRLEGKAAQKTGPSLLMYYTGAERQLSRTTLNQSTERWELQNNLRNFNITNVKQFHRICNKISNYCIDKVNCLITHPFLKSMYNIITY